MNSLKKLILATPVTATANKKWKNLLILKISIKKK